MSEQDLYQQDLFPTPRPSSPQELKKRFPYQFDGPHIGYSFATGWFPIFAQLCIDIDHVLSPDKHGFHWEQLKEKFGVARWYASLRKAKSPEDDDIHSVVRKLIEGATSEARRACIVCGKDAKPYVSPSRYVLQMCENHGVPYSTHGGATLPQFWISEEADLGAQA